MRLLVIGAHHGVGAHLLRLAGAAGHDAAGFEGDVLDAATTERAVAGRDAVLSTLGPRRGSADGLCSRGTANIVAAMRSGGVRRLIQVTGAIIGHPRRNLGLFYRTIAAMVPARALADRREQERLVMTSGLDWTLIRPTRLTDAAPRGRWRDSPHARVAAFAHIARADVAAAMLRALADEATIGQALTLQY